MNNKKVVLCLIILTLLVFILGMHGGSEYYFRDFCVHKTLNMFYNNGNPEFFKKPSLVSDIQAIAYWIFYHILNKMSVVNNFDDFTRLFSLNMISTPIGKISFMLPALIINNIFAAIGVCFTFLITYVITNKKIIPSFISGFILATTYTWMLLSHHLSVDIPLSSLSIATVFFTVYFIKYKENYSITDVIILGMLSGLCAATKYNGAVAIIAPLTVIFYTEKRKSDIFLKITTLMSCAALTFCITNPYILINLNHFFQDFNYEYRHAFIGGHSSADDKNPFKFHIFHSIPNAIGIIPFVLSVIGSMMFVKDNKTEQKIKFALLTFPVSFFILIGFSKLIFLRYILPLTPILAIFIGLFVNYIEQFKSNKAIYRSIIILLAIILIQNTCNAVHFYKIMSQQDTRVMIKNVFKTLNVNPATPMIYSDIFSNPYYEEDFAGQFPDLKNYIVTYLDDACNNSIGIVPRKSRLMLSTYDIVFFDSNTYDRSLQIQKDKRFKNLDNQYFMYDPLRKDHFGLVKPTEEMYVAQINPYKTDKSLVPFDLLRSDFKYRKGRGPFVEIYFKDRNLRNEFVHNCFEHSLECKSLNMKNGYYYKYLTYQYQF